MGRDPIIDICYKKINYASKDTLYISVSLYMRNIFVMECWLKFSVIL